MNGTREPAPAGPAITAPPAAPPPPPRAGNVASADVVRVLTFACVIAVHTISTTHALDDPRADAAVMLLHFTREAFFVLTAFVLTLSSLGRVLVPGPFWRRRLLLVGVPYVVWTVLYTALQQVPIPLPAADLTWSLLLNLATGVGWYHLYFLLVSLQFYLVFPLFRLLLVATRGRHRWLLLAALVAQVGVDAWMHDPAPTGLKAQLLPYAASFVGSYVFFLVLGGVLAEHRVAVLATLRRYPLPVVAAFVVTGAAAEWSYLAGVAAGENPILASDVFQAVMMPWVIAVVAVFALLGVFWAGRRDGRAPRWVSLASERSFGVFLVHPAFLWAQTGGWFLLTGAVDPYEALPGPLPTVIAYLVAVAASLVAVELFRCTPLRLPLTGKPSVRSKR